MSNDRTRADREHFAPAQEAESEENLKRIREEKRRDVERPSEKDVEEESQDQPTTEPND